MRQFLCNFKVCVYVGGIETPETKEHQIFAKTKYTADGLAPSFCLPHVVEQTKKRGNH